jgi:hypothetical protein
MVGTASSNNASPASSLRSWLDYLAGRDRRALIRPGAALKFELAAIAKHFEGEKATLFLSLGADPMRFKRIRIPGWREALR